MSANEAAERFRNVVRALSPASLLIHPTVIVAGFQSYSCHNRLDHLVIYASHRRTYAACLFFLVSLGIASLSSSMSAIAIGSVSIVIMIEF